MRYSTIFIVAGLLCLLVGEGFGIWMSQSPDRFPLHPAHAHLNLAGWVTLALYGLIHHAFPNLGKARLAPIQCALAIFGAIVMPVGILIAITSGEQNVTWAIVGSLGVLLGTLLFAIMFTGKVAMSKEVK
ncbi:MAG: hypothetical protein JSS00_11785 [Proteobacteria bacterium]|nr:hypothetical protein [Pseudomonadota bacterium]